MTYILITRILIFIAFPGALAFPIMYASYTRKHYGEAWHETDVGRHLMSFSVTIMLALLDSGIVILFRNYPGRPAVTVALAGSVAGLVWWRLILYIRYRFPKKRGKHHVDTQVLERRTGEMPEDGGADVPGTTGN